jgi:serine protease Do
LVLVAFLVTYGPTLVGRTTYAIATAQNQADRQQLAELAKGDRMSPLFRAVAKAVEPSVVVVHVKQRIQMSESPQMEQFLERFFGNEMPGQRMPPGPGLTPGPGQGQGQGQGQGRVRPAPRQQEQFSRGLGSGVIVDARNGYVLTNWHVVRDAQEVEVVTQDNRHMPAEWVRTDPASDLAIIKVKGDHMIEAPLGDSDRMEVGDAVLAIGSPEGLTHTVTSGIISAKGRTTGGAGSYQSFLQTDAAINHGNSGGPLVNMLGEVIGINAAIVSRTGVNEGIGLAVPSNMARSVMTQLIEKGKVTRGYLGVVIQNVDEKLAKSFNLPGMEGALVSQVSEGSPADKAGIKAGDFIVAVDGHSVKSVNELRNAVADLKPDKAYAFDLYREGKKTAVQVTLGSQPADMAAVLGGEPEQTATAGHFGIGVANLTDELREKFGYKSETKGVVIIEVKPDSDAAEQGLAEGMLILQAQGKKIETPADFTKITNEKDAASGIRLLVTDKSAAKRFVFVSPEKASKALEKPGK